MEKNTDTEINILVIGLGNPILGDDGIGWRVAEDVARSIKNKPNVQVECYALGGLSLMEHLIGFQRAILIDSIWTQTKPIGSVSTFPLTQLGDKTAGHMASTHDTSLQKALEIGRRLDLHLPEDENIAVVAIEAQAVHDFSEELTPPVKAAVPLAVEAVLNLLT